MEKNQKIAQMFHQIAALLDEQGVAFKPAAYRKAAQAVLEQTVDLTTLDEKELKKIHGIGEATAAKIVEFAKTGHMKHLDELLAAQGDLPLELMNVEGLGPKRVRQLVTMGITTVPQLIKAAQEGKLRELPRLSELLEKKILENAGVVTERSKRFELKEVEGDVEMLLKAIRAIPGIIKAEAAGSYRRKKETVGDIDILALAKDPPKAADNVAMLSLVDKVVAKGPTKVSFNLKSLLRVDVRFVHPNEWGSALMYFTGDKEHNITLRKIAIGKGWKLNEYGLFDGDKVLASKTEEEIYKKLGVPFVEPTKRIGVLS